MASMNRKHTPRVDRESMTKVRTTRQIAAPSRALDQRCVSKKSNTTSLRSEDGLWPAAISVS